jgi:hypothetical protein
MIVTAAHLRLTNPDYVVEQMINNLLRDDCTAALKRWGQVIKKADDDFKVNGEKNIRKYLQTHQR